MSNFYTRMGAAASAGAPIGVSVDVARTARNDNEAAQAGGIFANVNTDLVPTQVSQGEAERATARRTQRNRDDGHTFFDQLGGVVSAGGRGLLRALEWGTETTGNAFEASMRSWSDLGSDGFQLSDLPKGFVSNPVWGWTQADWRENWEASVDAQASVGQTMWLITEQGLEDRFGIDAGTSGGVRSGGLDLLDDPSRWGERQDYFAEGMAHWTTGVGDALWQIIMDPLIVGGKVASGVKAARRALSAEDVARVANPAVDAAELSGKQRRTRNFVRELATAMDEGNPGSVSALARSRYLRGSSDGGAIAYFMSKAGEGIDDVAERIAAREDVIYAGMGDRAALERLGARHAALEVELRKMTAPLDELDNSAPLMRPDLDDADAIAESYAKANDMPLAQREIEVQMPRIREELAALERVMKVGEPVSNPALPSMAVGELAKAPLTRRSSMRVAKTIQTGRFMNPINIVTGRHLPGTFQLSADDAGEVFHSAINRGRAILRGLDPETAKPYKDALLALEDDFLAAGLGASSKAARGDVVRRYEELVDQIVARKYDLDPNQLRIVHNKMRARRGEELREIMTRVYKAREAGAPAVINDGDELFAFSDEAIPVTRSQIQDWVSVIDPRRLDQFAQANFKGGLGGFVQKGRVSRLGQVTPALLGVSNRLWKFGALLRPYAYFVRAQVDTQARLLANMGVLKYTALAARGLDNAMANLRKVDKGVAAAYSERFHTHMQIDLLERRLLDRGVAPDSVARTPRQQAEALSSRADEIRAARKAAEDRAVEVKIAQLDERIGKLPKEGRGSVTRARLEAQRERLASGKGRVRQLERSNDPAFQGILAEVRQLDDELREVTAQIGALKGTAPSEVDVLRERLADLRKRAEEPVQVRLTGEKVRRRDTAMARHVGQGGGFDKQGNWKKLRLEEAYWGNDELRRTIERFDAMDSILGLVAGSTRGQMDSLRRTGQWDLIRGDNSSWEDAYNRAVNHQIRSDALGQRVLAGQSDEEILEWFSKDPQGRTYLRDLLSTGAGRDKLAKEFHIPAAVRVIERLREHVDTLLPPGTPVRAAALHRNVTPDDMKSTWIAPSQRPHVPGELLTPRQPGHELTDFYKGLERGYFKWVSQIPENMMGRHPFYAARFEQHAQNIMRRAGYTDQAKLTLSQVNDIRLRAAQAARKDVDRYLFDTSKQTNIGHALRFLSPFYGAWEDTMVKWARIFGEKPETLAYMWDVARSPNAASMVTDRDGNLIRADGTIVDDDGNVIGHANVWDGYVTIPLVGPLARWGDSAGAGEVRIGKNAANVIFQGDPWFLPGPGPVAAIPANEIIVKMFPDVWGEEGAENPLLKYLLPYGPTSDSPLEQALPSWAKAAMDLVTQDGRRVDQVFTQLYMEQMNAERNGEAEPMTDDDRLDLIANRTRNWALLRLLGTQMPFSFTPQSRLAWYKSEWDRYRREFGPEAEERFAADYPDYFDMAISLSANETGLTATDESWGAIQAYRNDIAKNPEYGWFYAGAANLAEGFSAGVYHGQMAQTIGPGTSKTFRGRKDPLEVAREAYVSQGWREYQQVNTAINLKLEERGLRSITANGASDLKQIRDEFVAELSRRNPDWAAAYGDGGSQRGRVTKFLSTAVDAYLAHPELMERSDGQALMAYLQVRDAIRLKMAERDLRSITAAGNADLKQVWDEFTGQLIESDLGFEQMWNRVLEHDDLSGNIYGGDEG